MIAARTGTGSATATPATVVVGVEGNLYTEPAKWLTVENTDDDNSLYLSLNEGVDYVELVKGETFEITSSIPRIVVKADAEATCTYQWAAT